MTRKLRIIKDIAAGMLHLQYEKVVHKDLAARNVLIGEHFEVKQNIMDEISLIFDI